MTFALNVAVDDALRQRELLLHGLRRAKAHDDEGQTVHLEYLLEALDDLLSIATSRDINGVFAFSCSTHAMVPFCACRPLKSILVDPRQHALP